MLEARGGAGAEEGRSDGKSNAARREMSCCRRFRLGWEILELGGLSRSVRQGRQSRVRQADLSFDGGKAWSQVARKADG
jgi:hypothetical protein